MGHAWFDSSTTTVMFCCPCGHRTLHDTCDAAEAAARNHLAAHLGDPIHHALTCALNARRARRRRNRKDNLT